MAPDPQLAAFRLKQHVALAHGTNWINSFISDCDVCERLEAEYADALNRAVYAQEAA